MARRLRFKVAQPITIIGWYMSAFLLIGLVVAASHAPSMQLPPEQNPALTGAFYYAILAAGLYVLVATIMAVTAWGAWRGYYSETFHLTTSQRTLMLQTIAYLVYLLGGAAVYARIEGWLFLDAVWWANYTLLTIGIGDFHVMTDTGKGLLFPYAIGGVMVLGLVVGSIRSLVLERGKEKMAARMMEKKREKVLERVSGSDSEVRVSFFSRPVAIGTEGFGEERRRKNEFHLMRTIQQHSEVRRKWTSLLVSVAAWLILWTVGAAVFWAAERNTQGLTYFEFLYFAYTSLLTIGYGDYSLQSDAGKTAFVFWSLLAVPTLTILISNMGDTVIKGIQDLTIWLGAFTVLPGEGSTRAAAKAIAQKVKPGDSTPVEDPPGGIYLPESNAPNARRTPKTATTAATERLASELEQEELDEAEQAKAKGDSLSEDKHLYHYLLVKEIRKVMKDVGEDPPKRYGYSEWAWFMRLLGEDEKDPKYHKEPKATPASRKEDMQAAAEGEREENKADRNGNGKHSAENSGNAIKPLGGDHNSAAQTTPWSWAGQRSPLMGDTSEPEWLLERLSERLEGQLRAERDKSRHDEENGDESLLSPATIPPREREEKVLDHHKKDAARNAV